MESLSALLVSGDTAVIRASSRVLEGYGFNIQTVADAPVASELITHGWLDLAIYDQEIPGAIDLASRTSTTTPGVVFALLDSSKPAMITGKRIHFSLLKPLSVDLFTRSMKAAQGLLVCRRRPAVRYPVEIAPSSTSLLCEGAMRHLDKVTILNISQTGMGLTAESVLPTGATIQVDFKLPKSEMHIQITGSIVWSHASGRAGVNIQHIAAEERQRLQNWLDSMPLPSTDSLPGTYRQEPVSAATEKQGSDPASEQASGL